MRLTNRIIRHAILVLAVIGMVITVFSRPPIPQDLSYHEFADQRAVLGIPNGLDVLSNLPFAILGLLGLATTFGLGWCETPPYSDPWERWPYAVLFMGVVLTAFGSGYYHLSPDNARLVWDRLPMTLGFMGLVSALLSDRVNVSLGRWLLGPLLLFGAGSVALWYWSELNGTGDLRTYLLVQFGSLLLTALLLTLYPARYPGTRYIVYGLAAYAVAKVFESADRQIFALGQFVSGHTLKHLTAALGITFLIAMLRARLVEPVTLRPGTSPV